MNKQPFHKQTIAIIGAKGIPPEFVGTSGVEFYIAQKIQKLTSQNAAVLCYVRSWATPVHTTTYLGARLVHTPSLPIKRLDALSHSFMSTIHACLSPVDIIWYHASGPALFSCIPRLFGKRVRITIHTLEWRRKTWGPIARAALRLGEWVGAQSAHEMLVVSKDLASYIHETYHKRAVVDVPEPHTLKHTRPTIIKKRYGLSGGDYILYLGRYVEEKRLEWLIRAYTRLHPKGVRLVLAGGEGYGMLYEKKIRQLSAHNKNVLHAGWVFGKEKDELLEHCRLFVLPSSVEGNPIVLHELPGKIPVVIPNILGEPWSGKKNAFIFQWDNEVDFIQTLQRALS